MRARGQPGRGAGRIPPAAGPRQHRKRRNASAAHAPRSVIALAGLLLAALYGSQFQVLLVAVAALPMLFGLTLSVLGLHGFYVGCIVRTFFDYGGASTRRWLRMFSYTRSVLFSVLAILLGLALTIPLVRRYFHGAG